MENIDVQELEKAITGLTERVANLSQLCERLRMERNMVIVKAKKMEEELLSKGGYQVQGIQECLGSSVEFSKTSKNFNIVPFHSKCKIRYRTYLSSNSEFEDSEFELDIIPVSCGQSTFKGIVQGGRIFYSNYKNVAEITQLVDRVIEIPKEFVIDIKYDVEGKITFLVDKILSVFNRI